MIAVICYIYTNSTIIINVAWSWYILAYIPRKVVFSVEEVDWNDSFPLWFTLFGVRSTEVELGQACTTQLAIDVVIGDSSLNEKRADWQRRLGVLEETAQYFIRVAFCYMHVWLANKSVYLHLHGVSVSDQRFLGSMVTVSVSSSESERVTSFFPLPV